MEDNPADAELILATLEKDGIRCEASRVETQDDFRVAIENSSFNLILADCSLPSFDGLSALQITKEINAIRTGSEEKIPETPFIFVTGSIGEELAIDTLKRGATDYVLKWRLSRLAPAVRRAIAEAEERAATLDAQRSRSKAESLFRSLFDQVAAGVVIADLESRIIKSNGALQTMLGYGETELQGMPLSRLRHPEDSDASLPAPERLVPLHSDPA
ncbi:MAG TPA: PAS domain S-box protein [Bryobacteraceae bacterium]|nr:PAS domain S-box protein [Bryobacteraceae bacterium]